jgi:hypothetical protein
VGDSAVSRIRHNLTASVPAAIVVGLVLFAGVALALRAHFRSSPARTAAAGPPAITVERSTIAAPIPAGFVGLSIELKGLESYTGTNPRAIDPAFLNLIRDIAPNQSPVLRIGGDSTDWSWWPVAHMSRPGGVRYVLTPRWMQVARGLASSLQGRLILGLNLEAGSQQLAATEARAMVSGIGRSAIAAFEIGNEPELYGSFGWYRAANGKPVLGRPRGYGEAQFTSDFSGFAHVLPGVALAGPSSGSLPWLDQLGSFLSAEPRVRLATVHAYPLKHCTHSTVVTIGQLLSDQASHGLAEQVSPYVATALRRHIGVRVDEMNAISCGGTRGVSDTFGSALWMLDALFEMARTGLDGVNIHTVPNTINEVLGPDFANGTWKVRVHPEYYGMIMFAQAAPPGSRLLQVSSAAPAGVKLWATRAPDGHVRVVLINKHLTRAAVVRLRIPSATGPGSIEQLRAPSVHATTNVTLGGQTFGSQTGTGQLAGTAQTTTLAPANGTYVVSVPAASATMLTLSSH